MYSLCSLRVYSYSGVVNRITWTNGKEASFSTSNSPAFTLTEPVANTSTTLINSRSYPAVLLFRVTLTSTVLASLVDLKEIEANRYDPSVHLEYVFRSAEELQPLSVKPNVYTVWVESMVSRFDNSKVLHIVWID